MSNNSWHCTMLREVWLPFEGFFFFFIFFVNVQNQSAVGNVIQLNLKNKPKSGRSELLVLCSLLVPVPVYKFHNWIRFSRYLRDGQKLSFVFGCVGVESKLLGRVELHGRLAESGIWVRVTQLFRCTSSPITGINYD